jgi:hypothetical protein
MSYQASIARRQASSSAFPGPDLSEDRVHAGGVSSGLLGSQPRVEGRHADPGPAVGGVGHRREAWEPAPAPQGVTGDASVPGQLLPAHPGSRPVTHRARSPRPVPGRAVGRIFCEHRASRRVNRDVSAGPAGHREPSATRSAATLRPWLGGCDGPRWKLVAAAAPERGPGAEADSTGRTRAVAFSTLGTGCQRCRMLRCAAAVFAGDLRRPPLAPITLALSVVNLRPVDTGLGTGIIRVGRRTISSSSSRALMAPLRSAVRSSAAPRRPDETSGRSAPSLPP